MYQLDESSKSMLQQAINILRCGPEPHSVRIVVDILETVKSCN